MEKPTLALAKVTSRAFSETLATKVEGVKGKDTYILANVEAETLVDLLASTVA